MITLAAIRRFLRYPSITALSKVPSVMAKAETLVMVFYAVLPFVAHLYFRSWALPLTRENLDPLWPLVWTHIFSLSDEVVVNIVRGAFLVTSIIGLALYRHRFARVVAFIGVWQAHALASSFGSPVHDLYPWVYSSFILIFLPGMRSASHADERNRRYLLVIWWAQAMLMLLYSMAGLWKFHAALMQWMAGEVHGFAPLAFAYQVADWLPKLQQEAPLAPFIIAHAYIVWPFYVGSHFFQLFAFWTMIRPSLQKIWAIELILFHIGTYLVMGIEFDPFILIVIALLVFSPFVPDRVTFKQIFFDLPVIGQAAEWYAKRRISVSRR